MRWLLAGGALLAPATTGTVAYASGSLWLALLAGLVLVLCFACSGLALEVRALRRRQRRCEQALAALDERGTSSALEALRADVDALGQGFDTLKRGVLALQRNGVASAEPKEDAFEPELALPALLHGRLASPIVVDVGANRGVFTQAALMAGFRVIAFEPVPELAQELWALHPQADGALQVHACALSDRDGDADLHIARNMASLTDDTLFGALEIHPGYTGFGFHGTRRVPVRTLDSLVAAGAVPTTVALLKVDTEGHDLAVIRGASSVRAEVILMEYWNREFVFNRGVTQNDLEDYLPVMSARGMGHAVVFWRSSDAQRWGVLVEPARTPRGSWGNVAFFRDGAVAQWVVAWAEQTFGPERVVRGDLAEPSSGEGGGVSS